jgi:regulator of replication initiation timing
MKFECETAELGRYASEKVLKDGLSQMTEANMSLFAENQILRSRLDRMAEYLRHVSMLHEEHETGGVIGA